jgi:alkaline phosphatase
METDDPGAGLRHVIEKDDMIGQLSAIAGEDSLIVFTADHSCLSVEDGHSGEEVLVAASGPGAQQVHGFFPDTRLFELMLLALGWRPAP